VRSTILHMDDKDKIEDIFFNDPPKLVLLESPTNPALRVHDLQWITRLCKKSHCISILDNTFAGFHHHGKFDIDIFVHSLTKHACGHSDAMGGAIISDSKIIDQIYPISMTLGATLDPGAASLILRGMKTYFLRTRESATNAKGVFEWLKDRRDIENLKYLGDENHPDYKLCKLNLLMH
ncbi:MAG: PLP-dependent transferase, partial [Proteobacteria bacterium]|nr:PLP-dependent transferase [Pseudomonadota bacterium]